MISVRNLTKEYENATPLNGVSVEINRGDVISIIGPSGTGKSTFLRCINLLEKPTAGQIFIDGVQITEKNAHLLRRKMGMVFQSFNLFRHLTVIENIMKAPVDLLGKTRQEAYERGMELLQSVGLADKAMQYPDSLSGGQKQRVAIARTLAMDPEIVLFDEPTSALDPTMIGEVLSVIRKLAQDGMTMLIVTHEMKFAKDVCSRVFYMDEGGIYEDGTPQQIFENPQKDRTRRFILQLKVLEERVFHGFDFPGAVTRIEEFGRRHQLDQKTIRAVQSLFEEVCMQTLLPALGDGEDVRAVIEYKESSQSIRFRVYYNGPIRFPDIPEGLSRTIIEHASSEIVQIESTDPAYENCVKFVI